MNKLRFVCGLVVAAVIVGSSAFVAHATAADTVKVGILHSLSGTMAISETSLRDVELMAIEEINDGRRRAGQKGRADRRRSGQRLAAVRRKGQGTDQHRSCRGHVRLLDLGQPQIGVASFRRIQPVAVLSLAVRRGRTVAERVLRRRHAEPANSCRPSII